MMVIDRVAWSKWQDIAACTGNAWEKKAFVIGPAPLSWGT